MPTRILDGKALAQSHRERIAERVRAIKGSGAASAAAGGGGVGVRLDAVLVGASDPASRQYAESQGRTCAELGIEYILHELPDSSGFDEIAGRILLLNTRADVSAIMLHLPLPREVDAYAVQRLIAPEKDVEGVNPANIGNIIYGRDSHAPCTALAVIKMIEHTGIPVRGKVAAVVGASNHVGKPIAVLLMRQDATVVSCNKWTADLPDITRRADILVSAAGVAGLIKADCVKPGAVLIDVGVNRVKAPDGSARTVGDIDFDAVRNAGAASWVSPVPGGVGPMTVAMLLLNVVEAAERCACVRPRTENSQPLGPAR